MKEEPPLPSQSILTAAGICHNFGGLMALQDIDFHIARKEIVGLIGPNGAGKTTLFNLFTGHYNPTGGNIYFNNEKINGLKPYQITPRGIARTFQNIRLFGQMSVLDNVLIGQHCRTGAGLFSTVLRTHAFKKEETRARETALMMLSFVQLEEKKEELAHNLSYGEQRRLEIARALATDPALLLLDEPAAGMNPQAVSYTHLDVYKRQSIYRAAALYWAMSPAASPDRPSAPLLLSLIHISLRGGVFSGCPCNMA